MDWLEFQQMNDCTQYQTMIECPHCGAACTITYNFGPGVTDFFNCGCCGDRFSAIGE